MNRRETLIGLAAGLSVLPGVAQVQPAPPPAVRLGIDVLAADGFRALEGRRIGLITNQTGVNGAGVLTRQILKDAAGVRLVSLFGPEHGLDTRVRAGVHVADSNDNVTGLPVRSLYGATRKPTPAMLADIDALVFDIQDIGIRSYTYISTMALAMEAAAENGKVFIVLDRPNPMGGVRVEGPPLEPRWTSFVGQVPVPYVHGLTIGELARMIAASGWIKQAPELTVIAMENWRRSQQWNATGLNWVATSPNIPAWDTPHYCAVTGILGELRGVRLGINTPQAFRVAGTPGMNVNRLLADLSAARFAGVRFAPWQDAERTEVRGVALTIDPATSTNLMAVAAALTSAVVRHSNRLPLRESTAGSIDLFKKAYGSTRLWDALQGGRQWQPLVREWQAPTARFLESRRPHLLYS